jgi:hypothetical protein
MSSLDAYQPEYPYRVSRGTCLKIKSRWKNVSRISNTPLPKDEADDSDAMSIWYLQSRLLYGDCCGHELSWWSPLRKSFSTHDWLAART